MDGAWQLNSGFTNYARVFQKCLLRNNMSPHSCWASSCCSQAGCSYWSLCAQAPGIVKMVMMIMEIMMVIIVIIMIVMMFGLPAYSHHQLLFNSWWNLDNQDVATHHVCDICPAKGLHTLPDPTLVWSSWSWSWSFLASQDALEVIGSLSEWVSELLTLRTELTDVTLVSEDTYWRLYQWDSCDWWYSWRWC